MCLVVQSCLSPCHPMDCVHGILQPRILQWIAVPFSRGSSWLRDQTWVSCIAGRFFTIWATREVPPSPLLKLKKEMIRYDITVVAYSLSYIWLLCDSIDHSPPGSCPWYFPGKYVTTSFSRGSSRPRVELVSPALTGGFFTTRATRQAHYDTVFSQVDRGITWILYYQGDLELYITKRICAA